MESCYIPNNPQYGLSLEYTFNNGATFNGTITGFPNNCDSIADGVLCCSGDLQSCSCGGSLSRLRNCGGHCHLNCGNGECSNTLDAINGDLDECTDGIDDCGDPLVERLEDCNSRLVNCDNSLVNCGSGLVENDDRLTNNRLVECNNHLTQCDGSLDDDHLGNCDNHLVDNDEQLRECDNRLIDCNGQLIDSGRRINDCDEQLDNCVRRFDNCDSRLTGCDRHLVNCDANLDDCSDRLVNCGNRLDDCDGSLRDCNGQLGDYDSRLGDCDGQLGDCEDQLGDCDGQLGDCEDQLGDCDDRLEDCEGQLGDGRLDECEERLGFEECRSLGQTGPGAGYWIPDEMASCSFSLPPLDLDPLPSLFPFSPCSGNYKGELKEKQPHEVADVLLSLKHAVVHPGAELGAQYAQQDLGLHPQMVMGGPGCYEPCGAGVFPTMSVNVSMNMTMHGYPPDQMCPQMQWGQNTPSSPMNVMYSQNQGVISPAPYPGSATYSFTADFRAPSQSDPLITATSSFKPIQITTNQKNQQGVQNYNIFSQKPVQTNFGAFNPSIGQKQQSFGSPNHAQIKTRSSKLQLGNEHQLNGSNLGPTYQILGGQGQNHLSPHNIGYSHLGSCVNLQNGNGIGGGKVQVGSLSGCSESEDEQKPNLCRICGKTYARPSTLKTHLRTHSGERPYRCSDCNKSFSQAANLTAHVRTHTGQKPFSCQICHRRFSQSSSVTTHMRTHSGERPYRCRACKKAFSDSSTLTKHLRIHSGEKPYQCKLCFLRFSQSGNLNRHMRVHGNNAALLG